MASVPRPALALIFAFASVVPLRVHPDAQATFRSGVRTIDLYATVFDRADRAATNLTKQDFEVFDNGRKAEISVFSADPQPLVAAILLDMSESMRPRLGRVRAGVGQLIDALRPEDRAVIGTFGSEVSVGGALTGNHDALHRVLHEELWPGGRRLLWNAVDRGITVLHGVSGRRVALVVTDNADTCRATARRLPIPCTSFEDVRRRVRADGVLVYAVIVKGTMDDVGAQQPCYPEAWCRGETVGGGQRPSPAPDTRDLISLADESGGHHVTLTNRTDLAALFARIADELRSQYVLGVTPLVLDGKVHTLQVRVKPSGFTVRSRRTYLASPN